MKAKLGSLLHCKGWRRCLQPGRAIFIMWGWEWRSNAPEANYKIHPTPTLCCLLIQAKKDLHFTRFCLEARRESNGGYQWLHHSIYVGKQVGTPFLLLMPLIEVFVELHCLNYSSMWIQKTLHDPLCSVLVWANATERTVFFPNLDLTVLLSFAPRHFPCEKGESFLNVSAPSPLLLQVRIAGYNWMRSHGLIGGKAGRMWVPCHCWHQHESAWIPCPFLHLGARHEEVIFL